MNIDNLLDEYRKIKSIYKQFGRELPSPENGDITNDDTQTVLYLLFSDTSKIKAKNAGLLEVPEGKSVTSLPLKHFIALARRKGKQAVMRGLNNLERWNKSKNPELASKIRDIKRRLMDNSEWKNL